MKRYHLRLIICIGILLFSAFGFLLAPNDPDTIDLGHRLMSPDITYPFGTDIQGRCLLSRILYAAKTSMGVVLMAFVLVILTACPIGLVMGYQKKTTSWIGDSILNTITALPPIAYLMVFIGAWGNSVATTFIALTLAILPRLVKLVKTKTELERNKAYVSSAQVSGCSTVRLLFRHILPNCSKEIISYMSLMCSEMMVMITSFSFIGLGLGDQVKDLGTVIQEAYQVLLLRSDIMVYPVVMVVLITLSFNLLGQEVQ